MNRLPLPAGTRVCVCDPQSVRTDVIRLGSVGSLMSKMRTPSQAFGLAVDVFDELQPGFVCGVSTEAKSRLPHTDTSNWPPLQGSNATCVGSAGSEMSITRRPE